MKLLILLIILSSSSSGFDIVDEPGMSIIWHWEDNFTATEQQNVENWLTSVTDAVEETLGTYPFDLHYHIYRRNASREPVPWASTRRHSTQGVDFYIDPSYSLQLFLEDWTAPHEISHLSIPFLGRENAWFAEGYASYMQYQIMETLGIYTSSQISEKYAGKMKMIKTHFNSKQDFVTIARDLQGRRQYADMYWGGASFFLHLDEHLRNEHYTTLAELIREYLECCRLGDDTIEEVIASLDKILGGSTCSKLLHSYQTEPASRLFD